MHLKVKYFISHPHLIKTMMMPNVYYRNGWQLVLCWIAKHHNFPRYLLS